MNQQTETSSVEQSPMFILTDQEREFINKHSDLYGYQSDWAPSLRKEAYQKGAIDTLTFRATEIANLQETIQRLEAEKEILKKQLSDLSWRLFTDELPAPNQEIWIVWPSGEIAPERRRLTESDLKMKWDEMRWMPVPDYSPYKSPSIEPPKEVNQQQ